MRRRSRTFVALLLLASLLSCALLPGGDATPTGRLLARSCAECPEESFWSVCPPLLPKPPLTAFPAPVQRARPLSSSGSVSCSRYSSRRELYRRYAYDPTTECTQRSDLDQRHWTGTGSGGLDNLRCLSVNGTAGNWWLNYHSDAACATEPFEWLPLPGQTLGKCFYKDMPTSAQLFTNNCNQLRFWEGKLACTGGVELHVHVDQPVRVAAGGRAGPDRLAKVEQYACGLMARKVASRRQVTIFYGCFKSSRILLLATEHRRRSLLSTKLVLYMPSSALACVRMLYRAGLWDILVEIAVELHKLPIRNRQLLAPSKVAAVILCIEFDGVLAVRARHPAEDGFERRARCPFARSRSRRLNAFAAKMDPLEATRPLDIIVHILLHSDARTRFAARQCSRLWREAFETLARIPGAWTSLALWPTDWGLERPDYLDARAAARELALRLPRSAVRRAALEDAGDACFELIRKNRTSVEELKMWNLDVSFAAFLGTVGFPALKRARVGVVNVLFNIPEDDDYDEEEDGDLQHHYANSPGMNMWQAGMGWVAVHRLLGSAPNLDSVTFQFDSALPDPKEHQMVLRHRRLTKLKLQPEPGSDGFASSLEHLPRLAMPSLRMLSLSGFCIVYGDLHMVHLARSLPALEVLGLDVRTAERQGLIRRLARDPGTCPNLRVLRLGYDGGRIWEDRLGWLAGGLLDSRPALESLLCRVSGGHDIAWGKRLEREDWEFVRFYDDDDEEPPEPRPLDLQGAR
ncbi:hypothetical protein DFJ74DRAFT_303985 [Hyaloraphidium curvatum]|nr:hypothetical protein DFJ74DRAFT_303985 [Hyaloraphidium curvatum]